MQVGAERDPTPRARAERGQAALLRAARALYVDGVTSEVFRAIEQAGIPAIVLKGPSIARWLYPTGGRTYGDTDLLVPPSRVDDAKSVLRSLGFTGVQEGMHAFERDPHANETPFVRSRTPDHPRGDIVDLHYGFPGLRTPGRRVWEVLSGECETLHLGGVDVRVLNRLGLALHIVVHAVQHGFGSHTDEDLRRVLDALPSGEWAKVALLARRLGVEDVLGYGLRRHPVGAEAADRLRLPELLMADSPYFWRNLDAPRGAHSIARLCSAGTMGDRAQLIRWDLFPSAARIRTISRLPTAAGGAALAGAYVRYWGTRAWGVRPAVRFVVRHADAARRNLADASGSAADRPSPLLRRIVRAWPDRWLLLEAGLCLGAARLSVSVVPFRWWAGALRQRLGETPTVDDPATLAQRRRVAWSIQKVCNRTPWDNRCLAQAMAGKQMLRRRGIDSTLYLGVARGARESFDAHAWLRSGSLVVTGGGQLERFTVIASFSD